MEKENREERENINWFTKQTGLWRDCKGSWRPRTPDWAQGTAGA